MNVFGSALASHLGESIDVPTFLIIQLIISSIQLSGQTANEYTDVEGDALNRSRTVFSGGSGMLSDGRISRRTAALVTAILAAISIVVAAALFIFAHGNLIMLPLIAIAFFLAIEYSVKPLQLESSGVGEAAMAITVGFLCPAVAFIAQGGSEIGTFSLQATVTTLMTFCLLIMIEYPDYEADKASGKKNMVVRFGRERSFWLGIGALLLAAALSAVSIFFSAPTIVALSFLLVLIAEVLALNLIRIRLLSKESGFGWLTTVSIGLYALAIALAALFLMG